MLGIYDECTEDDEVTAMESLEDWRRASSVNQDDGEIEDIEDILVATLG